MKIKSLAITVVVLAILAAAAYWYNRPLPPPPPDPLVGKPVLTSATVVKAAGIRITDQGKTVTLTREPDGSWKDDSYYGLPADFSKLSSLVQSFTSATITRVVTTRPDRLARLDFSGTSVQLLDASGHPYADVDLGKEDDQGGRFLRYDGQPKAYLSSNLDAWIDNDAKNWADSALVNVSSDDVARIEFTFPSAKPIVATRKTKDAPWTASDLPKGMQLAPDKISSALSTLTGLRFSDTSATNDPQALAAKQHLRLFRLTTFSGKTITVALGRKPEEKRLLPPAPAKPGMRTVAMHKAPAGGAQTQKGATRAPAKPKPQYQTIPAGPVYVFVHSSDSDSKIAKLMRLRAYQVDEYNFTSLPQTPADLLETAPAPPPKPAAKAKP